MSYFFQLWLHTSHNMLRWPCFYNPLLKHSSTERITLPIILPTAIFIHPLHPYSTYFEFVFNHSSIAFKAGMCAVEKKTSQSA